MTDDSGSKPATLLPFLGSRSYLHGTTLFEAMRLLVPPQAALSFRVSHLITSPHIQFTPVAPSSKVASFPATLRWSGNDQSGLWAAVPLPSVVAPERRPYPEDEAIRNVHLEDSVIHHCGGWPFPFVAMLIPLHKALLAQEIVKPPAGQWLFTQLELDRYPSCEAPISLQLAGVLGGGKLVRSNVSVDGRRIGSIDFARINLSVSDEPR